jgi:Fur family ferric uptake transcriptional regulator
MSCGERLASGLRKKGYRVTPQRGVILEIIAHNEAHQSVQEVFIQAEKSLPGLAIATVYRTLDVLNEAGLVDIFSTNADIVRFSLRDPDHPHYHLVCRNCDRILELEPDLIDELALTLEREHGFLLDSSHMTLTGICRDCAETASGNSN